MLRSHTCGELNKKNVGEEVVMLGWARSIRDHKDIVFVNLTDCYGWTQICMDKSQKQELSKEAYVRIKGKVVARPVDLINADIATGEIEVECKQLDVVADCCKLPFEIQNEIEVYEETRLKYRFLDLRRPVMLENLKFRSRLGNAIRRALEKQNFLEVETPMLVRCTPEGARDFVTPSRLFPGKFYALPQSPQLYKQMLMISGVDRYYQFARCFRDEDARRERQLVHTQVDLEMAVVSQEDIFQAVENMMADSCEEALGFRPATPFPRYTYAEVMERWGIDKPDLRFAMELIDFSQAVAASNIGLFEKAIADGNVVKGLVLPGCASYSRSKIKELENFCSTFHIKGLIAFKVKENSLSGGLAKKMTAESRQQLLKHSKANDGDLIVVSAGPASTINRGLGELRRFMGKRLELAAKDQYCFLWVTEFPLFEWDEDLQKWAPMHHMFTMPSEKYLQNLENDPGAVTGQLYDLVLNGVELGSGSIRISSPPIQKRIMKLIGMDEKTAEQKFGFLLDAYRYASPPHGGIGMGFDNLVMTLLGLENIREVIAFPNASNAAFLYDGAPVPLERQQIEELHIEVKDDTPELK